MELFIKKNPDGQLFFALFVIGLDRASHPKVVEPVLTTFQEVGIRWERPKINLAELAKKRREGLTVEKLCQVFGLGRTAIKGHLRQLRTGGACF